MRIGQIFSSLKRARAWAQTYTRTHICTLVHSYTPWCMVEANTKFGIIGINVYVYASGGAHCNQTKMAFFAEIN